MSGNRGGALQCGPPAGAAAELTRAWVGGRCSQSPQSGGTVAHILQHTGRLGGRARWQVRLLAERMF